MTSVERVYGYTNLEQEEEANKVMSQITNWPTEGNICFSDVSMSYRDDDVMALKNATLHIKGGEKV